MAEYIYRGFKISYTIFTVKDNSKRHQADGSVTNLLSKPECFTPVTFHAEFDSYESAEHEIKIQLENYVDSELKNFYGIEEKKTG